MDSQDGKKEVLHRLNGFWNFSFADILGISLSAASMIAALSIPKEIMKYKVSKDMANNIDNICSGIKMIIDANKRRVYTKEKFIAEFNMIDAMLCKYRKYLGAETYINSILLHRRYKRFIKHSDNTDKINKSDMIILLSDYAQEFNLIRLRIGSVDNDKQQ